MQNGKVRMYTPRETLNAEKLIAEAWENESNKGPKFEGPVEINIVIDKNGTDVVVKEVDFDGSPTLKGDIDNYVKTILDGLNGIAWVDDSQVIKIVAMKL